MYSIGTIIKTALFAFCFVALQGCGNKKVIEPEVMSEVLADIFLADQVIESVPSLNIQKDSMMVYPEIFEKHGVTFESFEASVRYYLQEDDSYLSIIKGAKKILSDREHELSMMLKAEKKEKEYRELKSWWAVDSIRAFTPDKLSYNKYLRSVRWLIMKDEDLQEWKFMDSAIVDIPQNPQWWTNTLFPVKRDFKDVFKEELEKINQKREKSEKSIVEHEKIGSKLPGDTKFRKVFNKARVSDIKR